MFSLMRSPHAVHLYMQSIIQTIIVSQITRIVPAFNEKTKLKSSGTNMSDFIHPEDRDWEETVSLPPSAHLCPPNSGTKQPCQRVYKGKHRHLAVVLLLAQRGRSFGQRLAVSFQEARSTMALQDLAARLNDREYKNWLKAARCLLLLREGLHPFTSHHMRAFHRDLLQQSSLLGKPCQTSCRPRGNTVRGVFCLSGLSLACLCCGSLWRSGTEGTSTHS